MIILLNASAKPLRQDYKQLKPDSEFGIYHRTDRIPGLQIGDRLSWMIRLETPNRWMTWYLMKLTTLEVLTSTSGIASVHFEK